MRIFGTAGGGTISTEQQTSVSEVERPLIHAGIRVAIVFVAITVIIPLEMILIGKLLGVYILVVALWYAMDVVTLKHVFPYFHVIWNRERTEKFEFKGGLILGVALCTIALLDTWIPAYFTFERDTIAKLWYTNFILDFDRWTVFCMPGWVNIVRIGLGIAIPLSLWQPGFDLYWVNRIEMILTNFRNSPVGKIDPENIVSPLGRLKGASNGNGNGGSSVIIDSGGSEPDGE